eukprot:scaffold7895_cov229-Pinguiococcus_pyrenoidosus.AAC.3
MAACPEALKVPKQRGKGREGDGGEKWSAMPPWRRTDNAEDLQRADGHWKAQGSEELFLVANTHRGDEHRHDAAADADSQPRAVVHEELEAFHDAHEAERRAARSRLAVNGLADGDADLVPRTLVGPGAVLLGLAVQLPFHQSGGHRARRADQQESPGAGHELDDAVLVGEGGQIGLVAAGDLVAQSLDELLVFHGHVDGRDPRGIPAVLVRCGKLGDPDLRYPLEQDVVLLAPDFLRALDALHPHHEPLLLGGELLDGLLAFRRGNGLLLEKPRELALHRLIRVARLRSGHLRSLRLDRRP